MPESEVDEDILATCTLVAGDFDKFIQFLLACLSLGVLGIKRWKEHPRRPRPVWMLDTSKQCFGAAIAHLTNLLISIYFARSGQSDECAIYFVNFFLDTTIGVFISYLFLKALQRTAKHCGESCWMLMRSGHYGDTSSPSLLIWAAQLLAWLLIIFATKLVIATFIYIGWNTINSLAFALFSPFEHHRKVELVLVMIIAPTILNGIQFWIQDNFLADEQPLGERLPLMKMEPPTWGGRSSNGSKADSISDSNSGEKGQPQGGTGTSTSGSSLSSIKMRSSSSKA